MDFAGQADFIRQQCQRFNVAYIGIDTTGLGTGVFQLVKQFRPDAVGFQYSPEVKTRLVLKALDVIHNGRLQFDASHNDIAASFLAIKKTTTASGRAITFAAGVGRNQPRRSGVGNHARPIQRTAGGGHRG
ncbi:hypothetical protein [Chromobacterium sphagni]|uniref:phage terminase large subunit family protein n=1 Tax=Chromobacterium sphagni TaxID=1903179 RepID=UPI000A5ED47B|nr:hypothetical protein [Chromobacterium sphagni]